MAILLRILGSSLLWLFMRAHSSNYIFFSLVVRSAHKMLSLTVSLRVRRLQVQNGFQALSDGLNPAGKMTLDQFNAIFSVCGVISEAYKDGFAKHTGLVHACQKWSFIFFTTLPQIELQKKIWSTFSGDHISFFCPLQFHSLDWHWFTFIKALL